MKLGVIKTNRPLFRYLVLGRIADHSGIVLYIHLFQDTGTVSAHGFYA